MKKILSSLIIILVLSALTISATRAYFSDTETSTGNRITAGTLDLNLEGGNTNVVKFDSVAIMPDETKSGTWTIHNAGSIDGYLDLHNITKDSDENGCIDSEQAAGDNSCGNPGTGEGELLDLLSAKIFVDTNHNNIYDDEETIIYNGSFNDLDNNYDMNLPLAAGETKYITMNIAWPHSDNDDRGQGDTLNFGMTFELGQTAGQ